MNIAPKVRSVEEVLAFYSEHVVPALAAAVMAADKFPEEVLNEIRNSYTHLARANRLAVDSEDYLKELDSAYRHLLRSKLDSLKLAVFAMAEKSEVAIRALQSDVALPKDVHSETTELRRERTQLSAHEGQEPITDVIDRYDLLFKKYDDFYYRLDEQFGGDTAEQRRKSRRIKSIRGILVSFISGVAASLLAAYVFSLITA